MESEISIRISAFRKYNQTFYFFSLFFMIAKYYKQNHNDLLFSLAHTASVAFALGTFATGLSPKSTLKSKPAMS